MSSLSSIVWCHACSEAVTVPRSDFRCPLCTGDFLEQLNGDGEGFFSPPSFLLSHFRDSGRHNEYRRRHRRTSFRERANGAESLFTMLQRLEAAIGSHNNTRSSYFLNAGENREEQSIEEHFQGLLSDERDGGTISRRLLDVRDFFAGAGLEHLIQQLSDRDSGRHGTSPALKSAVEAMPTIIISNQTLGEDEDYCAVCTEVFEGGDEVKQMPCKHIFHSQCILPWLYVHDSCPVCRHKMPSEDSTRNRLQPVTSTNSSAIFNLPRSGREGSPERGLALIGIPGVGIHVRSFTLFGEDSNREVGSQNESSLGPENDLLSYLVESTSHPVPGVDEREAPEGSTRNFTSNRNRSHSRRGLNIWPFRSSHSPATTTSTEQAHVEGSGIAGSSRCPSRRSWQWFRRLGLF